MRAAQGRSGAVGRAKAAPAEPRSAAEHPQNWEDPSEPATPGAPTHHPRPSSRFLKQQPRQPAPISHNPPLRRASMGRPSALLMRLALIEDKIRRGAARRGGSSAPPAVDDGTSSSEPSWPSEMGALPPADGPEEDSEAHVEEACAGGGDQPRREQDDGQGSPSRAKTGDDFSGAQRSPPSTASPPPDPPRSATSSPDWPSSDVADGLPDSSTGSEPDFGACVLSLEALPAVDDGTDSEISELLSATTTYCDDFEAGPSSPALGEPSPSSPEGPRTKDAAVQTGWAQGDAAMDDGSGVWGAPGPEDPWAQAVLPPSPAASALDDLLLQLVGLIRQFAQHSRWLRDSAVAALEQQEQLRYQYPVGTMGPGGPSPTQSPQDASNGAFAKLPDE